MTLICGYVNKEAGADSNGSGKSTIVKGITLALIGLPDRKLSIEDYIRNDASEGSVKVAMYNSMLNEEIVIERRLFRSKNKAIKTTVWVNGVENKQIIKDSIATEYILSSLDMTKEDLLNYFVINQRNPHSFLSATDTNQKKIISRFSNMSKVDVALEKVKAEKAVIEEQFEEFHKEMEINERLFQNIEEDLAYEREQRYNDILERKEGLIEELNDLKSQKLQNAKRISQQERKKKRLQSETLFGTNYQPQIDALVEEQELNRVNLKEVNLFIRQLSTAIDGTTQCPKCEHEFNEESDLDIESCRNNLPDARKMKKQLVAADEGFDMNLEILEEQQKEYRRFKREVTVMKEGVAECDRRIKKYNRMTPKLKRQVKEMEKKIKNLQNYVEDSTKIDSLNKKKKSLQKENSQIEDRMSKLITTLDLIKFWEINFGTKGLKTFLSNKVIGVIEGNINNFLTKFRINMKVKINGYTKLKSDNIREKIEVLVNRGGDWDNFHKLSGGQQKRLELCAILTLQKLINLNSASGGLNLLILDESFDGLDISGHKMIFPILEDSGVTNLVVTPLNMNFSVANKLEINYYNGISTIRSTEEENQEEDS